MLLLSKKSGWGKGGVCEGPKKPISLIKGRALKPQALLGSQKAVVVLRHQYPFVLGLDIPSSHFPKVVIKCAVILSNCPQLHRRNSESCTGYEEGCTGYERVAPVMRQVAPVMMNVAPVMWNGPDTESLDRD